MEKILENLREKNPLIHCISNYVTSNDLANIALALGASPIMADEIGEVGEIASIADGLLINIGTINKEKLEAILIAGKKAREKKIPIVFDPVGIGVSRFRKEAGRLILGELRPDIIKGNISEISYLYSESKRQKGVDSENFQLDQLDKYVTMCKTLGARYGATILMTGEIDIIANATRAVIVKTGNKTMEKITGTGCMLGLVVTSLAAVEPDRIKALSLAASLFSIAGDKALAHILEEKLGLGSFKVFLIDYLSKIHYEDIKGEMKIELY